MHVRTRDWDFQELVHIAIFGDIRRQNVRLNTQVLEGPMRLRKGRKGQKRKEFMKGKEQTQWDSTWEGQEDAIILTIKWRRRKET